MRLREARTGIRARSSLRMTSPMVFMITRGRRYDRMMQRTAVGAGPRIPALVISPYAVAHGVSHVPTEHSSVIKFVDEMFTLIPLADLPDEERGRAIGKEKFGQENLGPADDKVPEVGDLSSAFDVLRLQGKRCR